MRRAATWLMAAAGVTTVAIVGGGPSGLAAAKAAKDEGLLPTVFEQSAGFGGLWRGDHHGKVWQHLRTNLSKFTCAFSDSPWPPSAPDFPSAHMVLEYLCGYAETNQLTQRVRFNSRVTSVASVAEGGWRLAWQDVEDEAHDAVFDRVIIATGIFSKPHRPDIPGLDALGDRVLHASAYRSGEQYAAQRVLVVGAAFSGADIAADVARAGADVTLVASARTPLYYLPRDLGGKPVDLAFYSRATRDGNLRLEPAERSRRRHEAFTRLGGKIAGLPEPDVAREPYVAITDDLRAAVEEKKLRVGTSRVVGFDADAALLADGTRERFDRVILATGYRVALPFFSAATLSALEHDDEDWLQPLILHKCVWHPALAGLAFCGMYRGVRRAILEPAACRAACLPDAPRQVVPCAALAPQPYFATVELQARWACGVFSGRLPAPSVDELREGLDQERCVRHSTPRPQFPHGDYVSMADDLARLVGVLPVTALADEAHPLHDLLHRGPLLPFHYRLEGVGAVPDVAEAAVRECAARHSGTG